MRRFQTGGAAKGLLARELFERESARPTVPAGTRIGAFEVVELIGSGGMGAVYRAERVAGGFEQTVAIKLLLGTDGATRERFRAEMEILAGLSHPNIAQLIDGGEAADGSLYLAMEYVDGVALDEYCQQQGLDARARIRLLLRVADALAHAHRNLVIHRDIKPGNILVGREDGRPRLLDFGIAKLYGQPTDRNLTTHAQGPMTPTYAAPEQFRGGAITVATDVYQLGVLMYCLLSGGLPYDTPTDDPLAWARAVLESDPLSLGKARMRGAPGVPPVARGRAARRRDRDLDAIVQMALRKDPQQRYGSVDAFAADLEAFLDGRPVVARHGGPWYYVARFVARHRWAVNGSSLAVLGLATATLVAIAQAQQARSEAERLRSSVDLLNSVFKAADLNSGSGGRRSLEDLLDVAAKDVVQRLEGHPDLRAGVLLQVADAHSSMGLPARAAPLYGQAIADLKGEAASGMTLAQALDRGALAAYWNGEFRQAQQWADEAAALAVDASEASAQVRHGVYFTRWQMYRSQGRHADCYRVAQQSLEDAQRVAGPAREPLLQRSLVRRGTSATDLQRYEEGERDLLDAVALARRMYGAAHAETLKAQQALGWHYVSRGQPQRGLELLESVGERVREVFGDNSSELARNWYNRGNAYSALDGRWESALEAYSEAARIYRQATSRSIAIGALYNVASLLRQHGRCAEALPVYAEVEDIWRETRDLRHQLFRRVYIDLIDCALETGDLQLARERFDQAIPLYPADEQGGGEYAELLAAGSALAAAAGDAARAQDLLGRAIAVIADDPARASDAEDWRQRLAALAPTAGQRTEP